MGFRLVPNSVTLNDREWRNGRLVYAILQNLAGASYVILVKDIPTTGSKMVPACTVMLHLTILKSMASRIFRLRSLRGDQFRSFSRPTEDTQW